MGLKHTPGDYLQFAHSSVSKRELLEMAKGVFFSAETDRGKMLAAYVIARFSPGEKVSELDAEIISALNELIDTGELKAVFPDKYQQKPTKKNSGSRKRGRPPKARDPRGKECTKCGVFKPYSEFHARRDTSDHKSVHCKECRSEYMANRRPKAPTSG